MLTLSVDPAELADLMHRFGDVPHQQHDLTVHNPFLTHPDQRLTKDLRRAEICYIMHRGRAEDGVLLHIKTIYPAGAYRLPTGGIHHGEGVLATLGREIYEETGLVVGDGPGQVQVQRFLGAVSYAMNHAEEGRTHSFATYHFLVQAPVDAVLQPVDESEQIGGWLWCPAAELAKNAEFLATLGSVAPEWGEWGRFRALSHRFVAGMIGNQ